MKPPPVIQSFTRHIAQSVYRGEMSYFDAEYQIASLFQPCGYYDADTAFDELSKAIGRYLDEAARLSKAIRASVRPMFDRRKPPDEIKKTAAHINRAGFLTASEIQSILQSEYNSWKSQQILTKPIGNQTSMTPGLNMPRSQHMRE
ncbi:MAG TPA: hypothetical protein PLI96_11325 [Halothiobacillus sp.]|nr:hypothetical protein [Halothiobacillus sp.]